MVLLTSIVIPTVLGEIIERASGSDLKTYADENLFLPLGVQAYWWQQIHQEII